MIRVKMTTSIKINATWFSYPPVQCYFLFEFFFTYKTVDKVVQVKLKRFFYGNRLNLFPFLFFILFINKWIQITGAG